jgi:hypothetical protein
MVNHSTDSYHTVQLLLCSERHTSNKSLGFEKSRMAELTIIEFLLICSRIRLHLTYPFVTSVGDRKTALFVNYFYCRSAPTASGDSHIKGFAMADKHQVRPKYDFHSITFASQHLQGSHLVSGWGRARPFK